MHSKKYFFITLLISLSVAIFAILYGKYEKNKISKLPVKFAYESDSLISNPILYINNLDYKNAYLDYVNRALSHERSVPINFPLLYFPGGEKIYIGKYLDDSVLVEFYNPESRNVFGGFKTGYIHKKFIHDNSARIP